MAEGYTMWKYNLTTNYCYSHTLVFLSSQHWLAVLVIPGLISQRVSIDSCDFGRVKECWCSADMYDCILHRGYTLRRRLARPLNPPDWKIWIFFWTGTRPSSSPTLSLSWQTPSPSQPSPLSPWIHLKNSSVVPGATNAHVHMPLSQAKTFRATRRTMSACAAVHSSFTWKWLRQWSVFRQQFSFPQLSFCSHQRLNLHWQTRILNLLPRPKFKRRRTLHQRFVHHQFCICIPHAQHNRIPTKSIETCFRVLQTRLSNALVREVMKTVMHSPITSPASEKPMRTWTSWMLLQSLVEMLLKTERPIGATRAHALFLLIQLTRCAFWLALAWSHAYVHAYRKFRIVWRIILGMLCPEEGRRKKWKPTRAHASCSSGRRVFTKELSFAQMRLCTRSCLTHIMLMTYLSTTPAPTARLKMPSPLPLLISSHVEDWTLFVKTSSSTPLRFARFVVRRNPVPAAE